MRLHLLLLTFAASLMCMWECSDAKSVPMGTLHASPINQSQGKGSIVQPKEGGCHDQSKFAPKRHNGSKDTSSSTNESTYSIPLRSFAGPIATIAKTSSSTDTFRDGCKCGVRNTASRIIGGTDAGLHEYPWQVALVMKGSIKPICGGSIISNQWIVTAAHCLALVTPRFLEIVVGEHNWKLPDETTVTQRFDIEGGKVHPNYNPMTKDSDIALLKLSKPIDFPADNKIAPICFPKGDNIYEDVEVTVTGWGVMGIGGENPPVLKKVKVITMSNAKCQSFYENRITVNMICAADDAKDACKGDSGGPLVIQGSSASMELIGIVSWGKGCGDADSPGVYTRLTNFLPWIQSIIGQSHTCPPAP